MMGAVLRRIHPEPAADVTIREAYDVARTPPDGRPWIELCMVASLDGSTVVNGTSRGLSNAHDSEVFLTLRDLADVIVVGAGTARAEGYGPPRKAGQRVGVVSNSGRVDANVVAVLEWRRLLDRARVGSRDRGRHGPRRSDAASTSGWPSRRCARVVGDVAFVHAEGGPRLNGTLATADLIDELNLTMSPLLAGGAGPRLTVGGADVSSAFDLAHLVVDEESFVFSRWVRRRAC